MENISGATPLTSIPTDKTAWSDFTSLNEAYEDIAKHMFVSVDAGKSIVGARGPAGSIQIGQVNTLEPDQPASVSNSGNTQNAIFNFGIPKGEKGETGEPGTPGPMGPQGPAGSSGAAFQISTWNIIDQSTYIDVPATINNIFQLEYVQPVDPQSVTLPNMATIGPILDLQSGYMRVFFTDTIDDSNYRLLVYAIA